MNPTTTAPRFQVESLSWTSTEPDYRPSCLGCGWSWQPGRNDDPLLSRQAASTFARAAHPTCGRRPQLTP